MKKRRLPVIFVSIIAALSLFCISAAAETTYRTYDLSDIDMSVKMPEDINIITREEINAPLLSEMEIDSETIIDSFIQSGIHLNAFDDDFNYEIVISEQDPGDSLDYNLVSDQDIENLEDDFKEIFESNGAELTGYEVYNSDVCRYAKIQITYGDPSYPFDALEYYTVQDGVGVAITLTSYSDELSANQEEMLKNMVDSIVFENAFPLDNYGWLGLFSVFGDIAYQVAIALLVVLLVLTVVEIVFLILAIVKNSKKKKAADHIAQSLVGTVPEGAFYGTASQGSYSSAQPANTENLQKEQPNLTADNQASDPKTDVEHSENCEAETFEEQPHDSDKPSEYNVTFCNNCGEKLDPDAVFCTNCGQKVK